MNSSFSAWLLGIGAFLANKPRAANPYVVTTSGEVNPINDMLANEWNNGWNTACVITENRKRIPEHV